MALIPPTAAELDAARTIMRRHGGHMRKKALTKAERVSIAKKANLASQKARRKNKS